MDVEIVIDAIERSLRESGIAPASRLRLSSISNNLTFTDQEKVFVKFPIPPEYDRGAFGREVRIGRSHSKDGYPLLEELLPVSLGNGKQIEISVWNYVENIPRRIPSLSYLDGKRVGQRLNEFHSTPLPLDVVVPTLWSMEDVIHRLAYYSTPLDVVGQLMRLRNETMERLNELRSEYGHQDDLVLTHGDPHAYNVIWDVRGMPQLVDFECAVRDYVECDLAGVYQSYVQIHGNHSFFAGARDSLENEAFIREPLLEAYIAARNVASISYMARDEHWEVMRENLNNIEEALRRGNLVEKIHLPL